MFSRFMGKSIGLSSRFISDLVALGTGQSDCSNLMDYSLIMHMNYLCSISHSIVAWQYVTMHTCKSHSLCEIVTLIFLADTETNQVDERSMYVNYASTNIAVHTKVIFNDVSHWICKHKMVVSSRPMIWITCKNRIYNGVFWFILDS